MQLKMCVKMWIFSHFKWSIEKNIMPEEKYPEAHGYLTAYATIVEVNTLFHSLSKKFKGQTAFVHAFHATWIGLRLGWYPYLLAVVFPRVMQGYSDRVYWQVVGSQAVLVGLNFIWTAEVVYGLLRPKKRKAP